jgi:branched-chain amino acid transport system ATP-binding protein
MLKLKEISSGYGIKQVLFNVSIEIEAGDIVLLVGSNGSGKSTLLKTIYGILPLLSKGSIYFNGEDITGYPTSELITRKLLYLPQKDNLFENLSVKENLYIAGLTIGNKNIFQQRIEKTLSVFKSLTPKLKDKPIYLSGGERQILSLAMALLHEPKMLLIDEPFTGLSHNNIILVRNNLKLLNKIQGTTIMIVEHRINECIEIANKIIALKLGKVVERLTIDSNFNSNILSNVFV